METEKVNTGETAPNKDFLDRVSEISDKLRSMAQEDVENRVVLLITGEGEHVTRLLQGRANRLADVLGKSLALDEEGHSVMLKAIIGWLGSIDTHFALFVTKMLYETVEQISKEEESRPKAEA